MTAEITTGLTVEVGEFWTGGLANQIRITAPLGHCHIRVNRDGLWARTARKPSTRHRKMRQFGEYRHSTTEGEGGYRAVVESADVLAGLFELVGRYYEETDAAHAGIVADYIRENLPKLWANIERDLLA